VVLCLMFTISYPSHPPSSVTPLSSTRLPCPSKSSSKIVSCFGSCGSSKGRTNSLRRQDKVKERSTMGARMGESPHLFVTFILWACFLQGRRWPNCFSTGKSDFFDYFCDTLFLGGASFTHCVQGIACTVLFLVNPPPREGTNLGSA
jgi:hypothetical protein